MFNDTAVIPLIVFVVIMGFALVGSMVLAWMPFLGL